MLCSPQGRGRLVKKWLEGFSFGHAAWMCLCRERKETERRWFLGLGTHRGIVSWCPECTVTQDWEAGKWVQGNLSCVFPPQPYIMFLKFITHSYLSEISQMRRLLQEKGDNLQAPPRQERPHGVLAMWECVGRLGRGKRRSEMPLLSPAASLQLWGAQPRRH